MEKWSLFESVGDSRVSVCVSKGNYCSEYCKWGESAVPFSGCYPAFTCNQQSCQSGWWLCRCVVGPSFMQAMAQELALYRPTVCMTGPLHTNVLLRHKVCNNCTGLYLSSNHTCHFWRIDFSIHCKIEKISGKFPACLNCALSIPDRLCNYRPSQPVPHSML